MKKFMILYLSPVSAREQMANASPEQMQAGMREWLNWREKTGKAIVDLGAPLASGKHIEAGKVTGGNLTVTGYSIVQANSIDEAVKLFKEHPHFKMPGGASIEVLEFVPMPGM